MKEQDHVGTPNQVSSYSPFSGYGPYRFGRHRFHAGPVASVRAERSLMFFTALAEPRSTMRAAQRYVTTFAW
jgi:hypothetical protein